MRHHFKNQTPALSLNAAGLPKSAEELEFEEDERSLDLVQRVVICLLLLVVGGGVATLLSIFSMFGSAGMDRAAVIGLWVMGGITGLVTAAAVLLVNRRHPYSPLLLLGLIPMALGAFLVLG